MLHVDLVAQAILLPYWHDTNCCKQAMLLYIIRADIIKGFNWVTLHKSLRKLHKIAFEDIELIIRCDLRQQLIRHKIYWCVFFLIIAHASFHLVIDGDTNQIPQRSPDSCLQISFIHLVAMRLGDQGHKQNGLNMINIPMIT